MFNQIRTIALNTFTESVRQPVFVVILLVVIFGLAMNPLFSAYTMDAESDNKLLVDLGLSTMLIGGLFMAAFSATGVLSREIENRTVLTVISKPISRPAFVAGKYLGVAASLALAFWVWSMVFLMATRHKVLFSAADKADGPVLAFGIGGFFLCLGLTLWGNYFYGWVFTSSLSRVLALVMPIGMLGILMFDKQWKVQPITTDLNGQLLLGMLLVLEALLALCAVAIAASTRLGQIMTLLACMLVFLLGVAADKLTEQSDRSLSDAVATAPDTATGVVNAGGLVMLKGLRAVTPSISDFWIPDAITQGHLGRMMKESPENVAKYVGLATLQSFLFAGAALAIGVALFQKREVG